MAKIDYIMHGSPTTGKKFTYTMEGMRGIMEDHLKNQINDVMDEVIDDLDNGFAFNIESLNLNKLITNAIKELIAKQVLEKLTPYYTDEFYSTLRYYGSDGVKLRISPWWDDVWQEIKLRDLVKEEMDSYGEPEKEDLIKFKEEFDHCSSLIETKLNKMGEDDGQNNKKMD